MLVFPAVSSILVRASAQSWMAFGHVPLFSMFLGFFFWYKGSALGGIARVGPAQMPQSFLVLSGAVRRLQ